MPISWRRENDGFIMTHKLKTETFSQKIDHSGGVILLPLTPLFSFVTFHLKRWRYSSKVGLPLILFTAQIWYNTFFQSDNAISRNIVLKAMRFLGVMNEKKVISNAY